MPAASTKPEKASYEATEPIKQVIQVVEKKVRNLEKRKGKLDGYKAKADTGVKLEKDQQAAVDKYDEVMQTLEFARELQKQFQGISVDAEKMQKKQVKREKLDRQNVVLKRFQEMLNIQNLLDSMGSEKVRSDFQTGKHGAVVLTEENLTNLDELYKLISPSREGKNYPEELNLASEHILSLLDSREKEVVGTTYKDLKELLDLISNCGYFENAAAEEEEAAEETTADQEFTVSSSDIPQTDSAEVESSHPTQVVEEEEEEDEEEEIIEASQSSVQQPEYSTMAEADSFFSKTAPASTTEVTTVTAAHQQQAQQDDPYNKRPFQDIVSAVQGSFNFLQESTIDMESPHMDPAVVAAHPMPPAPLGYQTESLSPQTFTSQGFADLSPQVSRDLASSNKESTQSLLSQQQASLGGASDYSSQTFGQSLQSDALFPPSAVKDSSSQLGQSVLGQTSDSTISKFEIPPAIPMPPGIQSADQESSSEESQAEKKFKMNPNAEMFQSLIHPTTTTPDEFGQQQGDVGRPNYQGNNYNSGYRGNRGGGGGFRGKNNRGGGGGGERGGNMSNGFSGGRGGRGGNYGGNSGGGQRGGFQGVPPRSNDSSDKSEGYQNHNGNFGGNNNGGGFQKRGGGGQPRGNNRGGAMRGGPPRGSMRGGQRGAQGGGGFGRPPQQQAA